jgi:Flp pilus assembly protein TadG
MIKTKRLQRPAGIVRLQRPSPFFRLTKRQHPESGAQIAEAAVVLPILFLVILGIFYFSLAFNIATTVQRAAQQGAQAAARPTCATCGNAFNNSAAVRAAVQSALLADHLDPANIVSSAPPQLCTGGGTGCFTSSNVQICTTAPLNCGNAACQSSPGPASCGTGTARGTRVSFGYRYRSPVPLGNWGVITLHASAQGPREN